MLSRAFSLIIIGAALIALPGLASIPLEERLSSASLETFTPLIHTVNMLVFTGGITFVVIGLARFKDALKEEQEPQVERPQPAKPNAITLEAAPLALAKMSAIQDMRQVVEHFEATRAAWLKTTEGDMGGDRPRLEHGIRVVQKACFDTIENPALLKSQDAHTRITGTMGRITAEMERRLEDREKGDLANLELDLATLERQLSLPAAKVA